MIQDDRSDEVSLTTYLRKLHGASPHLLDYQLLQDGISGATLYQLQFPDGQVLLKITPTHRGLVALNRARRELAFYRDLAAQIPLRVPQVMAMTDDADGVVLQMALYHPSPPPVHWSANDYLEAARQLGQFHATFWAKTERLAHLRWLAWHQTEDVAADIQQADSDWQTLRAQPRFADVLTTATGAWLRRLLGRLDIVQYKMHSLPLTVCHGDFTPSNILRDSDGQLVWADWQEVRLAHGPEDLSFFFQRAETDGAIIPRDTMIQTYQRALEAHTDQIISLAAIQQIIDAAELWVRVLYWPAYLVQASESALVEMLDHIRALALKLDIAT